MMCGRNRKRMDALNREATPLASEQHYTRELSTLLPRVKEAEKLDAGMSEILPAL